MAKPAPTRTDFVQAPLKKLMRRVIRTMNTAIGKDRSDVEIRDAFDLPPADAPLWAHSVKGLATQVVRVESANAPMVTNNLNLTMIDRSASNAAWLDMVKGAAQLPAKPDVIEVQALPVAEVVKK